MMVCSLVGTISVSHASLGWRKPVKVEGITLKGVDGRTVVSIPEIGTRAPLWSIVTGRSGLGRYLHGHSINSNVMHGLFLKFL